MPRPKQLPDEVFIRMPEGTKKRLEALSKTSPVPAIWLRQFLLTAIEAEESKVKDGQ